MGIDRYIIPVLCLASLCRCHHQTANEFIEIRKYQVDGVYKDSVWCDTVYRKNFETENFLSKLIHQIDSALVQRKIDFTLDESSISIKGAESWKGTELTKYTVEHPIKYGTLSFYGIYAQGIGTVYWRSLDGYVSITLIEKQTLNKNYSYRDLAKYIHEEVLAAPVGPK